MDRINKNPDYVNDLCLDPGYSSEYLHNNNVSNVAKKVMDAPYSPEGGYTKQELTKRKNLSTRTQYVRAGRQNSIEETVATWGEKANLVVKWENEINDSSKKQLAARTENRNRNYFVAGSTLVGFGLLIIASALILKVVPGTSQFFSMITQHIGVGSTPVNYALLAAGLVGAAGVGAGSSLIHWGGEKLIQIRDNKRKNSFQYKKRMNEEKMANRKRQNNLENIKKESKNTNDISTALNVNEELSDQDTALIDKMFL